MCWCFSPRLTALCPIPLCAAVLRSLAVSRAAPAIARPLAASPCGQPAAAALQLQRRDATSEAVVPQKHKPYSPFQNLNNKAEYAVARLDDLLNWGRKVGRADACLARQAMCNVY